MQTLTGKDSFSAALASIGSFVESLGWNFNTPGAVAAPATASTTAAAATATADTAAGGAAAPAATDQQQQT